MGEQPLIERRDLNHLGCCGLEADFSMGQCEVSLKLLHAQSGWVICFREKCLMIASVNSQLQPGIDGGMKSVSHLLEAIIKVRTTSIILFREFRFSNAENFTGSWILVCVFYSHWSNFFFFF